MGFAIGENVGPYRITVQLGSGGMATVYKAYHAALDRYVAIKVMHAAFKEDASFTARFQREAKIVARLDHPHIVPVYDFSEHDGQPYLVMRFVEGETLKARLQAGPLTVSQVMDLLRPVCQALAYAHEQGVLHRDIKPSNILLTPQGGVFLTEAKERDDRYTTVSELLAALEKAAEEAELLPAGAIEPPPCEETAAAPAPAAPTVVQAASPFKTVASAPAARVESAPSVGAAATVVAQKGTKKSHRKRSSSTRTRRKVTWRWEWYCCERTSLNWPASNFGSFLIRRLRCVG